MQHEAITSTHLQSLSSNQEAELEPFSNILKQLIQKKTKRGRKSKNELPQETRCEICLEYAQYSLTPLIKCTTCQAEFHSSCYKYPIENPNDFTCLRCLKAHKENRSIESYKCDGVLYEQEHDGEFYHQICLKFIPELCEEAIEEDRSKETIRRWRYKNSCKYCREKLSKSKAVIKCCNPKCKCFYHIPCAIQKGMIFSTKYQTHFFGIQSSSEGITSIPFFCSGHNKKLAAGYRNDIIYQRKGSLYSISNKTELLSSKETTEEYSESYEDYSDNFSYGHSDINATPIATATTNAYGYDYENNKEEHHITSSCSNALRLNFDAMIEHDDYCYDRNAYSCINESPKIKIPFGFNFIMENWL